jgi:hypothetical protein
MFAWLDSWVGGGDDDEVFGDVQMWEIAKPVAFSSFKLAPGAATHQGVACAGSRDLAREAWITEVPYEIGGWTGHDQAENTIKPSYFSVREIDVPVLHSGMIVAIDEIVLLEIGWHQQVVYSYLSGSKKSVESVDWQISCGIWEWLLILVSFINFNSYHPASNQAIPEVLPQPPGTVQVSGQSFGSCWGRNLWRASVMLPVLPRFPDTTRP